jgi:hypothetical protein
MAPPYALQRHAIETPAAVHRCVLREDLTMKSCLSRSHPALLVITVVLIAGFVLHAQSPQQSMPFQSQEQQQQQQQQPRPQRQPSPPPTPGPMLADGTMILETPEFNLTLVRSSETVASLKPKRIAKGDEAFDFAPGDLLVARSQNGYYHLGDLDLRVRAGTEGEWKSYSTSAARTPVAAIPADSAAGVLAAADLATTLPPDIPLQVTRAWAVADGKLVLRFTLKNKTTQALQVGALGIPLIFNNVLSQRSLDQAHALCSFHDPYIGLDAGYLQVTRLSGRGPALIVVPDDKTPFEAYNPILGRRRSDPPQPFTDPTPRSVTFEGFYDWMVHSQAFAEKEWSKTQPWNPPTKLTLAPGESKTYGLKFLLADEIRSIEETLAANKRPVAVGIPGYIVPMDIEAQLFLKYPRAIKSISVEPAGALTFARRRATKNGWEEYAIRGKTWGRARLEVTYADGLRQTIHYRVIKPAQQAVADMGRFLTTQQWFDDPNDHFRRSPSVMNYDRELNQIVMQDARVWIAGLSDEGGAGAWLAAMMKELGQPDKTELEKLQKFVDGVLWGDIQFKDGERAYGVRKSLFYYQPEELPAGFYRSELNWTTWTSWNKKASEALDRSFNYPHVAAAYWVMYRVARNYQGLVTNHPWDWYLKQAFETSMAMTKFGPGYARFGLMEGDIFLEILRDLKREKMTTEAEILEAAMRKRADRWKGEAYPFGSEMPWDSTGQEEVYAWTRFFGHMDKAEVTLNAILGYMPTVPHWGYNGSARRYWDFIYGASAKYSRIERQLHHYGSGINAIPVLSTFRDRPEDFYLLRVGYAGTVGAITNIDEEGFASAAFHAFPDMLQFDPLTGDYGPNFFGHAINTATYLVNHPEFGWVSFGGNVKSSGGVITLTPLDSFRTRVYLAPIGLWLTLDAGKFQSIEFNPKTGRVRVGLDAADAYTPVARLRIEQPAQVKGVGKYQLANPLTMERDTFAVPLGKTATWIEITPRNHPEQSRGGQRLYGSLPSRAFLAVHLRGVASFCPRATPL